MTARVVFLLLLFSGAPTGCLEGPASLLEGMVTQVKDGDHLKVQLQSGPVTVRLDSIDAPELNQPYGAAAKLALSELVARGEIELKVITQDRDERIIAVVNAGGINVNEWMVKSGHAWAYRQHLKDANYCVWEDAARDRKKGLWRLDLDQRLAPWQWRAGQRGNLSVPGDLTSETMENCIAAIGEPQSAHLPASSGG